jgi:hypothetical protein
MVSMQGLGQNLIAGTLFNVPLVFNYFRVNRRWPLDFSISVFWRRADNELLIFARWSNRRAA